MTEVPLPSLEEWNAFGLRITIKVAAIDQMFLTRENGCRSKSREQRHNLTDPHVQKIERYYDGLPSSVSLDRYGHYRRYLAYHMMIGSTPNRETQCLLDLPGELSIEKHLDRIILSLGIQPPRIDQIDPFGIHLLSVDETEKVTFRLNAKLEKLQQVLDIDGFSPKGRDQLDELTWPHKQKIFENYEPADYVRCMSYNVLWGILWGGARRPFISVADFPGDLSVEKFIDDILSGPHSPKRKASCASTPEIPHA